MPNKMAQRKHRGHIELQGRQKSVRASDDLAVLVVPNKAKQYRKALYFFNFVLTGLGLSLISMGIVMQIKEEDILMPSWMTYYMCPLGTFQLILGLIAARGAAMAKKHIESGRLNWWLYLFLIVMTVFLLVEFVFVFMAVIEQAKVENKSLEEGGTTILTYIEDSFVDELKDREEFWWEWQKTWECCGWKNNTIPDELATGKFCTTDASTSAENCKEDLENYINNNAVGLIIFLAVFILSQMFVWYSACQLGCCIQAQEPVYSSS